MAARTDTHRPNGGGPITTDADVAARAAAESGKSAAALAPPRNDAVAALTQRLDRLTEEVSESRQQGEQLKATLEKSMRRLQQLIGERDRLASLLAGRDAELQRLNRELGALTERKAPAAPGSTAFLTAARAMLERIRRARKAPLRLKSPRPQPETPERTLPAPRLVPWVKNDPPKTVLAVVVLGLSEAEIESVLGVVEGYCTERDLAPLLLTDNDAFRLFRGRRVLFEFLPAPAERERHAPDLDWRLFTLRRLALIRRKWQPARVVAFGRTAAEIVDLWLDSPFEATPIPAMAKGRWEGADIAPGRARHLEAIQS